MVVKSLSLRIHLQSNQIMIRNELDNGSSQLDNNESDSIEVVEEHFEEIDLEDIIIGSETEEEDNENGNNEEGDWDSFIELYDEGHQPLHASDSGFTEDVTLSMISDENDESFVENNTVSTATLVTELDEKENVSSRLPRVSSPAIEDHHGSTTALKFIDNTIPYISKISQDNENAIGSLLKSTQHLIKNNIKVLKQISAEKNTIQSRLDTTQLEYIRLRKKAGEERRKFEHELQKCSREEKEQKARTERLTDVIEELRETITDQSKQLEEQKYAFKNLSESVLEIMDEFGKSAETANQSLISNESRLQELFGKCETLVKNVHTKKSTLGRKFSLNIFRTKKSEEARGSINENYSE